MTAPRRSWRVPTADLATLDRVTERPPSLEVVTACRASLEVVTARRPSLPFVTARGPSSRLPTLWRGNALAA